MGCLPDSGVLGLGILTAPVLVARGLSRRATRWFILHHQRHLQRLSVKRRTRKSRCVRDQTCSELLMPTPSESDGVRVRPVSEPAISQSTSLMEVVCHSLSENVGDECSPPQALSAPESYFQGQLGLEFSPEGERRNRRCCQDVVNNDGNILFPSRAFGPEQNPSQCPGPNSVFAHSCSLSLGSPGEITSIKNATSETAHDVSALVHSSFSADQSMKGLCVAQVHVDDVSQTRDSNLPLGGSSGCHLRNCGRQYSCSQLYNIGGHPHAVLSIVSNNNKCSLPNCGHLYSCHQLYGSPNNRYSNFEDFKIKDTNQSQPSSCDQFFTWNQLYGRTDSPRTSHDGISKDLILKDNKSLTTGKRQRHEESGSKYLM
ncbi:hypothetical protein SK128_016969 [Halocaridina rubra]|uniref:Uncharacterized protein n=1 Tax=Halocaridina rubra TaxID=373956 RepID=A0AAN9A2Z3_HALRR